MSRSPVSRALTPKTTLEQLRKDAKRWLKALRADDPGARTRLRAAWPKAPAEPVLRDLQHALAREYGQDSWIALKAELGHIALTTKSLAAQADLILGNWWGGDLGPGRRLLQRRPELACHSLFMAAACGDVAEVERRLASDPQAATRIGGPRNCTALAYLAYGRLDDVNGLVIARRLLEAGADPNFQFDDGWENPFKIVTGVIGLGEGARPSHPQAGELVDLLIAAGAAPYDSQALYNISIVGSDTVWYGRLWDHCEAAGALDRWFIPGEGRLGFAKGMSTLDYLLGNAVGQGHVARAAWLLERDADPNINHFYTGQKLPLVAKLTGPTEMAALLERYGAKPALLNDVQALQVAALRGDRAMIEVLLAKDPSLIERPEALHYVVGRGDVAAFDLLVSLGARTDHLEQDGISPLHRAVQTGSLDLVKRLIDRGADVDLREKRWHGTPMSWAVVLNQPEVAEFLAPLSHDVRPLAVLGRLERLKAVLAEQPWRATELVDGSSALFCFPDDDEEIAMEAARLFLAHGADPTRPNAKGETPAAFARSRGLDDLAEMLEAGHAK